MKSYDESMNEVREIRSLLGDRYYDTLIYWRAHEWHNKTGKDIDVVINEWLEDARRGIVPEYLR